MANLAFAIIVVLSLVTAPGEQPCPCDCNGNEAVEISELVTAVRIALGLEPPSACPGIIDDRCLACRVGVDNLVGCVRLALDGCLSSSTPLPSATPSPTDSGSPHCTPPPCAGAEVLTCSNCPGTCEGGCGLICATRTPRCTVPLCGPDEVLYFPQCSRCAVCGTRTPTPSETPTPAATATVTHTGCPLPTECPTSTHLVRTPGRCPFCAPPTVRPSTATPTNSP